jgi:hypothetical protein
MLGIITNRISVVSVAIATILLGTLFITGSQRLFTAPITISRGEYETALSKWNSLHVSEYEQTFHDFARCRFRMVVSVERSNGNPVDTITQFESLGSIPPDDNPYCQRVTSAKGDTVEWLFQWVDYILTHPTESATNPYHGFHQYYSVQFDPTMGYPSSFDIYDGFYHSTIAIERLKVLK